ncbi:8017_t:CDS:2 [Cetraspora pellucida]|uniref:8017_t:CDS:1 n=1 Tax=Cetraspora pellucida TaxID=1433469 RepID=A0ACA9N677_9GLOM|nr:8017_t:CDS:2 [Cetraspora pellucida]
MHNSNISLAPSLYSPQMWSENLVGRPHVGVYTIIEEFQKEQQKVDHQVEAIIRSAQYPKPKKGIIKEKKI